MVRWLSGVEGIYMILTSFQHRHLSVRNYVWFIKLLFYSLTLSKDGKQQLPFVFCFFTVMYIHVIPQLLPLALMQPVWWFPYAGKSPCQTFIQVNRPAVASSTGENPSPFVFPSFDVQKMPNSANISKEGKDWIYIRILFEAFSTPWVSCSFDFGSGLGSLYQVSSSANCRARVPKLGSCFFWGTRLGGRCGRCAWTWSNGFFFVDVF